MIKKRLFGCALAALSLTACNNDNVDCATFEWGYSYTNGPDLWGQCEADCNGKMQSPINIITANTESDAGLTSLQTTYNSMPIDVEHNGHAIELAYEGGGSLAFEGRAYEIKQAHLHGGSEHQIDGESYPLEMHLVHSEAEGGAEKAVIGVFVEEGAENVFFSQFFGNLPKIEGEHFVDTTTVVNLADFLPTAGGYYTYKGSLTTPPCSEVVTWIVMKEPVTASAAQIELLKSILHISYRPVQKLNRRVVRRFE